MTIAFDVRARYTRACAEMLRHGLQLASEPVGAYRTGSLLLRGSPTVAGFLAGWLTSEFPPHVVTGHALSGVTPLSIGKVATSWAAQRADRILADALRDALGDRYRESVRHPISDPPERRGGVLHSAGAHRRYAAATSDIVYLGGEPLSNMFARLDRGRYCRTPPGYHALVREAGLRMTESAVERCHPKHGLAKYLMMTLEPS